MNAQLNPSLSARASDQTIALNKAIKLAWLEHIRTQPTTAAHHAVYALLRGKSLDKTFTPLKSPGKIAGHNGVADAARQNAEAQARRLCLWAWEPFAVLLKDAPVKLNRYERIAHPLFDRLGGA